MNNSNLSKKNLISYIDKNYDKFKLFLKKLQENNLMTPKVFTYAYKLTPKKFDKVINKMPDKKFDSLVKLILESNKKLLTKSMKGGAYVGMNHAIDCSGNNYKDPSNCYIDPISLDCIDDISGVLITPDNKCYEKVGLCDWFSRGNTTNPTTNKNLNDNWIRANCPPPPPPRRLLRDFGDRLLWGVVLYGSIMPILNTIGMEDIGRPYSLTDFAITAACVFLISFSERVMAEPWHGGKINSIKAKKKYSVKRKTRRKRGKRRKTRKRKRRKSKRRRG